MVEYAIQAGILLGLLSLGFFAGRYNERRHRRGLERREAAGGPVLTNLERLPNGAVAVSGWLCMGSVVIASDYFKTFGASLKTLLGGRLKTLETVLERGRREAALRLREQAAADGADMVLNVRFETAIVMRGKNNRPYPAAEVVAYGTGVKLAPT